MSNQVNKTAIAKLTIDYNNFDVESYWASIAFITCVIGEKPSNIWYLHFCILKDIYNNEKRFTDLYLNIYEFITAEKDIIKLE